MSERNGGRGGVVCFFFFVIYVFVHLRPAGCNKFYILLLVSFFFFFFFFFILWGYSVHLFRNVKGAPKARRVISIVTFQLVEL